MPLPSTELCQTPERLGAASPAQERARGMPLPQRLRLVARRLEEGLRETPQRFMPLAHKIAEADQAIQDRILQVLVNEVLGEAVASSVCPPHTLNLLTRAREAVQGISIAAGAATMNLLTRGREAVLDTAPGAKERRQILTAARCGGFAAGMPPASARSSVNCWARASR